jgi:lauroyl/myristoyl acyltransferase
VAPSRHHIHLEPPLEIAAGATREDVMQRVVDRFETFIQARPDQWYAFRPMFKSPEG